MSAQGDQEDKVLKLATLAMWVVIGCAVAPFVIGLLVFLLIALG